MRILVAGATGTLGHALVKSLHDQGHEVVANGRDRRKLEELRPFVKDIRPADLTKPFALAGICRDVDLVVSAVGLVGVRALGSKQTHEQVDYKGNLNLLREAEKTEGVQKFVYVSVQHAESDHDEVALLHAKHQMEEALKTSKLDWLIVRPTVYFEQIRQGLLEQARRGVAVLAGKGDTQVAPIDARDVATWIAKNLDRSREAVPLGGPETFTYDELARMSFEAVGKKPRILHVPPKVLETAARVTKSLPVAASGELKYLEYALTHDHVAPPAGERHLRDDLQEHARGPRAP